jgi:hypothetical protein
MVAAEQAELSLRLAVSLPVEYRCLSEAPAEDFLQGKGDLMRVNIQIQPKQAFKQYRLRKKRQNNSPLLEWWIQLTSTP